MNQRLELMERILKIKGYTEAATLVLNHARHPEIASMIDTLDEYMESFIDALRNFLFPELTTIFNQEIPKLYTKENTHD